MPDRFILQLPTDSNSPGVQATDIVPVVRGDTTYQATFGKTLLPAASAGDAGKTLRVTSSGDAAWQSPSIVRNNIYIRSQGAPLNTQLALTSPNRFSQYMLILVGYAYGSNVSDSTWKWSPALFYAAATNTYFVSSLRGSGWFEFTTNSDTAFTLSSSDTTLRVFRIDGIRI